MRRIAIGSDHGGFDLKEIIKTHLTGQGAEVTDCGTNSTASCDYPAFAQKVAQQVKDGRADIGILVCGTGIGMSIAANKIPGIRAAAVTDCFSAAATRKHNNANILCLGQRVLGSGLACLIVDTFLREDFDGGRHQKRLDMITQMEQKTF